MTNRRKTGPLAALALQAAARYPQQSLHERIRNFRNLIKHLVRLRGLGLLTDDDFNALVKTTSATFIEAEATIKVAEVIDNKLSKAMKNQRQSCY